MVFLLAAVNAKYIHSNPAIYSLRASAGEEMWEHIRLAEYTINQSMREIMTDIYERHPDAVGFSCYIWNWNIIRDLLRELPKVLPDTDIWLGGPEVSFDAPEVLKEFPRVRGVMVGEGEDTFRELMRWYTYGGKALERIEGLCLSGGHTPPRASVDLSGLPFLYGSTTKEGDAGELDAFANRIVYYESGRGCPYRCSYCLSSVDKGVRFRNMELVKKELRFFLDHRVRQVKFVDRTFNCDHERAMEIWRYLHEHDNGVTNFHFEIAADILREEEIELLREFRPGQIQLEIGVQSVNPETLRAIRRAMDVERLESVVGAIRGARNIHLHLDLIAGLPHEDYASFARSFNRVHAMRPDQLQLGFLKVLKGSPMAREAKEYGIVSLDEPPYEALCTKWLTYGEVVRLKRVEQMVESYYNSNQFTHTLLFLERQFESPFALYEALADYYKDKGYFVESPARAYRYQALFEFAAGRDADRADIYRELLTYDLYLRENVKSRPDFVADTRERPEVREWIREFYRREEREREFLSAYGDYDWKQLSRMTHLEPFRHAVWEASSPEKRGEESLYYVLFDYHARNPLDNRAAVRVIGMDGRERS